LKPLQIIGAAEAEFQEALLWYRDHDPRVAERFLAEARKALALIEGFPQIGGRVAEIDDPAVRSMPVHSFPYRIVFADLGDRLEVVAFAHHRRKPAYFVKRLDRS
jgi:toxin ParE1/3/4